MDASEVLTRRERDYLLGLLLGKSAKQIVEEQGVSVEAVRCGYKAVVLRLGLRGNRDLIPEAIRRGWVEVHLDRVGREETVPVRIIGIPGRIRSKRSLVVDRHTVVV